MTVSLYHAAQAMQSSIIACADPETGVIDTDRLDAIACSFQDRATAVVAVYKAKGHTLTTLEAYKAEIQAQIDRETKNRERLKDYLHASMVMAGVTKIASDDGLLTATLYPGRDESVELDDGASFPPELCADPKPPIPSKTKIKAAILAGEPIQGAQIVRRDRLQIK